MSCSVVPLSPLTVMVRPIEVMCPDVTAGAPPRPIAFPIATTSKPVDTVDGSANVTVGRPDTPQS